MSRVSISITLWTYRISQVGAHTVHYCADSRWDKSTFHAHYNFTQATTQLPPLAAVTKSVIKCATVENKVLKLEVSFFPHLSWPVSNPFVPLVEVFLEVNTAGTQNVLQRYMHHGLHITQPALERKGGGREE